MLGGGSGNNNNNNGSNNANSTLSGLMGGGTDALKSLEDDVPLSSDNIKTVEDDDEMFGNSSTTSMLKLRIKSFKDVDIAVPASSKVSHLKDVVRQALGPQSQERYLRLICKGRLLDPDAAALSEFKVHNHDVVHAVLAAPGVRGPSERRPHNSNSTSQRRRRGGTVVGPGGRVTRAQNNNNNANNQEDDSSSEEDEEMGRERMGFDRLRVSGLSRQEIAAIRTYFNRHVDRHAQVHAQDHANETDLRRRRLLFEEDWMSLQGPTSEFRLNLSNNTLLRFATSESTWRTSLGSD
ncbi:MAG: hypothetical protein SGARI_005402, partial [Bacillariaceae sp.]